MERYERLEAEISELPPSQYLNAAIQLSTEPLKLALAVEAKAWKTAYGHSLNDRYRSSMENIVQFVTEYSKKLARPIKVSKCGLVAIRERRSHLSLYLYMFGRFGEHITNKHQNWI